MNPESGEQKPLPPVWDRVLDQATFELYFKELQKFATIHHIQQKRHPTKLVDAKPLTLESARELLLSGNARAIQIRYGYEAQEWFDTLFPAAGGIKMVRMLVDFHPESDES